MEARFINTDDYLTCFHLTTVEITGSALNFMPYNTPYLCLECGKAVQKGEINPKRDENTLF
jgi:hypothetical protein